MQLSFFDHAMKYQGGKKSMKFLNEMKEIIPFKAIENILIGSLFIAKVLKNKMSCRTTICIYKTTYEI